MGAALRCCGNRSKHVKLPDSNFFIDEQLEIEKKIIIGTLELQSQNLADAIDRFDEAAAMSRNFYPNAFKEGGEDAASSVKLIETQALSNLGTVYFADEKYQQAEENYQLALSILNSGLAGMPRIEIEDESYIDVKHYSKNSILRYVPLKIHLQIIENLILLYAHSENWKEAIKYSDIALLVIKESTKEEIQEQDKHDMQLDRYRCQNLSDFLPPSSPAQRIILGEGKNAKELFGKQKEKLERRLRRAKKKGDAVH